MAAVRALGAARAGLAETVVASGVAAGAAAAVGPRAAGAAAAAAGNDTWLRSKVVVL